MVDIIDEANDKAEQLLFQCITLARSSLPTRTEEGEDIICKECGDTIRPKAKSIARLPDLFVLPRGN